MTNPCFSFASTAANDFIKWLRPTLVSLFSICMLQSCIVYNSARRQDTNICSTHKTKMTKTIVKTRFGKPRLPCSYAGSPNAKRAKCMGCLKPVFPIRRLAIIYHCSECDSLKTAFDKSNLPCPIF
jgi:hypothetical protein